MSVECCIKEEENSLGSYVANSEENLVRGVAADETINTKDTLLSGGFKKLKQNWHEKKIHGQFVKEIPDEVHKDKTWQWLSKSYLKIRTKAFLAPQEQTIMTKNIKHHIDKTSENCL